MEWAAVGQDPDGDKGDESKHSSSDEESRQGNECCKQCCQDEPPVKTRDPFWDNYKGCLALCVLTAHLNSMSSVYWSPWPEFPYSLPGRLQAGFVGFVCSFMMPGFSFASGFVSKATIDQKRATNLVRHALAFFIMHGSLFLISEGQTFQADVNLWRREHPLLNETNAKLLAEGLEPLQPPSHLPFRFFGELGLDWYLWAIVIWRCTLPLIARLRLPLLVSFVFAIAMIWTDAFKCSYSLLPFTFLPFFVCGYLGTSKIDALENLRQHRLGAGIFILSAVVIVGSTIFTMDLYVFFSNGMSCLYGGQQAYTTLHTYEAMVKQNWTAVAFPVTQPSNTFCQSGEGLLHIFGFYALSSCLMFASMSVVPVKEVWLMTNAGKNAVYIYLTQMWFVIIPGFVFASLLNSSGYLWPPIVAVLVGLVASIACWACLAQQWVRCLCGPCVEPPVERCCTLP